MLQYITPHDISDIKHRLAKTFGNHAGMTIVLSNFFREIDRLQCLEWKLHSNEAHPDYEYVTVKTPNEIARVTVAKRGWVQNTYKQAGYAELIHAWMYRPEGSEITDVLERLAVKHNAIYYMRKKALRMQKVQESIDNIDELEDHIVSIGGRRHALKLLRDAGHTNIEKILPLNHRELNQLVPDLGSSRAAELEASLRRWKELRDDADKDSK